MEHLLHFRQEKDAFFRNHPHSPILREERADFTGLNYYDPNPALDLEVTAEEFEEKADLVMQTSTGDANTYQRWGQIKFQVDGEDATLTLFFSPLNGHFFLPFMDSTSGEETYGAGRYLDPEPLGDNRFHIDFNVAYSPFCAYNPNYSCPIPPKENRLTVRIEAGEKNYK